MRFSKLSTVARRSGRAAEFGAAQAFDANVIYARNETVTVKAATDFDILHQKQFEATLVLTRRDYNQGRSIVRLLQRALEDSLWPVLKWPPPHRHRADGGP